MNILFVEARKKQELDLSGLNLDILPNKILLAYSAQYKALAERIKEKMGKRVAEFRQVLGCAQLKSNYPILLVSSGEFHAINLALQGNTVYILEDKIRKLDEKEIEKIRNRRKAALSRFLAADKIGILVSLKPGQENFKRARDLKKKLGKKGKSADIFLADNINIGEFENYDIESWINTACPALSYDSRILNESELKML